MKLSNSSFLKICVQPLGSLRSILFYGNSEFWTQLKIDHLIKKNPALYTLKSRMIPQETLLENKEMVSRLFFTKDLFSGPEIIFITQATDKITPLVEDLVHSASSPFFIVRALDYLRPSSKLRKFYESDSDVGSMPCYEQSSSDLEKEISSFFTEHGKKIAPDLAQQLGKFFFPFPDTLKAELEKILAYIGAKEKIETEDLKSLISVASQTEPMDLVNSFLDKDRKKIISSLASFPDTTLYISCLRSLSLSLYQLHHGRFALDTSGSLEKSIKALAPPLLFNEVEFFKKRLFLWSLKEIEITLKRVMEIEISIKKNSKVAKEIFEFFFLEPMILI